MSLQTSQEVGWFIFKAGILSKRWHKLTPLQEVLRPTDPEEVVGGGRWEEEAM